MYAIDAAGKRLVEFPELKANIDNLVFSAGPDGFAAVMSAVPADQACRSWLLVPTGQARPFEECWDSVRFSPSGTRLLVGIYDARRESRAAVYSFATGAKERDLPAVHSPVWLRA